jgi:alkylation response protein AidB-like acyl-CoA dehydrogenase
MMLAQFLLPLVQDGSLGGVRGIERCRAGARRAGYTREWPVERYLRDARVFPIFESTTGI